MRHAFPVMVALVLLVSPAGCGEQPAAPTTWGVPPRVIRFVSYNTLKGNRGQDRILADIRSQSPDIVFLQEVATERAGEVGRALGMHQAFHKHVNYPVEGIAIYSRFPLANVAPVVDDAGRTCALFADVAVDGRSFTVATVHLQATSKATLGNALWSESVRGEELALIRKTWAERGSRPLLIGGDFNQIPAGPNYSKMTRDLKDALAWIGKPSPTLGDGQAKLRVDYFLCSEEWEPRDGGVAGSGASDHRLIWLEARAREASTQPATRATATRATATRATAAGATRGSP